jgi:hypothetical protein
MFAQQNSNFAQPATQAQLPSGPLPSGTDSSHTGQITISEAETGTAFFVHTGGNEAVKDKLKDLGGTYNSHARAYRFPTRDMEKVIAGLQEFGIGGVNRPVGLVDPRKVIEVTFEQKFQYPGDMAEAEAKLRELGLVKKGGRSNAWTGDLPKAGLFLQAFGIGQ